jgi:uncharacterized Fe-S cluster-containing radical SAM superfamily protein
LGKKTSKEVEALLETHQQGFMMKPTRRIETESFSATMREKGIDLPNKRILITNYGQSVQSKDFTVPANCGGFGRIHHFRRAQPSPWPDNPLPMAPASSALRLPEPDLIRAQVFQNAICSWRCWYCFVDFDLLSANRKFSEYKSANELIDLYLNESNRPHIIDLSGGQPDLVPEWSLWFVQALRQRNLQDSVFLWTDDNLSNDYLWRYLKPRELMQLVAFPNYGRVGCFKGFNAESFSFNTMAEAAAFEQQFVIMKRLVESGFDVYGYTTFTTPSIDHIENKMSQFVDRLQETIHPLFPLRTVPLHVSAYTPTKDRIGTDQQRALEFQQVAVEAWNAELSRRFSAETRQKNITEHLLGNR